MRCRSCDTELPQDAAFCPKCGARRAVGVQFETIDRMIEDYRHRLDDQPDDADARFNLALAYKQKRLHELAIAELERLREHGAELADLEYELADSYLQAGQRDRAKEAIRRAFALDVKRGHRWAGRFLRLLERE